MVQRFGSAFPFMTIKVLSHRFRLGILFILWASLSDAQPLPPFLRHPSFGMPIYWKGPPDTTKIFKTQPLWKANVTEPTVSPFVQSVESLEKSGSFARSFSAGTNQSAVLQSNFNLQVSGQISSKVKILANLTDNIQPTPTNGITQSLQDFDRIYVALQSDKFEIGLGDLDVKSFSGDFLRFNRNVRGVKVALHQQSLHRNAKQEFSFSSARGRFARQFISVKEGNQGPYRLAGAQGETFIVILANSERVFIDGNLQRRGELYDYIIDYNTAVISFTPNKLITAQSRVIIEFEYANQAYVRSLTTAQFSEEKGSYFIAGRAFLEQDAASQPLQLTLDSTRRAFLSQQYSGFSQGLFDGASPAVYTSTGIFYRRTDSLGFSPVWVYTNVEQSGLYQVQFSFVGQGRGDYQPGPSLTNGRIYEWIAPEINGKDTLRKGSYAPLIQLVAPSSQLGLNLSAGKKWLNQSLVKVELIASKKDSNTLASPGIGRWGGGAIIEGLWNQLFGLKAWSLAGRIEQLSQNVLITQPYRAQEFAREWLIPSLYTGKNEWLNDVYLKFNPDSAKSIKMGIKTLSAAGYQGLKPYLSINYTFRQASVNSFLEGLRMLSDTTEGTYLRLLTQGNYRLKWGNLFVRIQHESNLSKTSVYSPGAFRFTETESGIRSLDSSGKKQWEVSFAHRLDEQARLGLLQGFQEGHSLKAVQTWSLTSVSNFKLTAIWRKSRFYLQDSTLGIAGNNLLIQADFNYRSKNGVWQFSTFYNSGGGQEVRRDFVFLEVPKGQGTHIWVDYNNNGIKELNEFESAFFADQANFVRVLMPATGFIPSLKSRVNYTIGFYPDRLSGKSRLLRLMTPFAILHSLNLEQNLTAISGQWWEAPQIQLNNNRLISGLYNSRTTLYILRTKRAFSSDVSWFHQQQQVLGTNGTERSLNNELNLKIRSLLWGPLLLETMASFKNRERSAIWAPNRNFSFQSFEIEPQLSWLTESGWQFQGNLGWKSAEALPKEQLTRLEQWKTGLNIQYNSLKRGQFKLNFSRVNIEFFGLGGTAIAFEMLQGLLPGRNLIWTLNWTRELGEGIQLSLQYDGRSSDVATTVHTGRAQVRLLL